MVRLWLVSGTKADDREGDFPGADVHGGKCHIFHQKTVESMTGRFEYRRVV